MKQLIVFGCFVACMLHGQWITGAVLLYLTITWEDPS